MLARVPAAVTTAFLASILAVSGSTGAIAATTCADAFAQLQSDVTTVPIDGVKADKERAGLLKLVGDASALADGGKNDDAVVKLTNLQAKIDDLAAAGQVDAEAASSLTTDTAAVARCLSVVGFE